jgi:hypothetical protein
VCSTLVGDIAEVKAIKKVFTDTKHLKMNATKSLIGHCLGAAAGIEAVAVVKAIQTGWLHPTLNQDNLVEEVAGIDTVPNEKKQHKVRAEGTLQTNILVLSTCHSLMPIQPCSADTSQMLQARRECNILSDMIPRY